MFTIVTAPLPDGFTGNLQQLYEAIVDRMEVTSDSANFVIGNSPPLTNQGPWLKGGKQWWVWDEDSMAYIPLDLSASLKSQEIFVGPNPPDVTQQDFPKVWLKTVGVTLVGVFYWFGSTAGWVTVQSELQPNVITNLMIQDDAVTTEKIADLAVTIEKFAPNIPLTKLAKGGFSQFLRMVGLAIDWQPFIQTELLQSFTTSDKQIIVVPHGLPGVPSYVRVCLHSLSNEQGFNPLDELDIPGLYTDPDPGSGGAFPVAAKPQSVFKADATNITIYLRFRPTLYKPAGSPSWAVFTPDPSLWNLKIYAGI